MLQLVLAQVHYQPDSWKEHAHTDYVQAEFGQIFQLKYVSDYRIVEKMNDEEFFRLDLFSRRTSQCIRHTIGLMLSITSKIFTNY